MHETPTLRQSLANAKPVFALLFLIFTMFGYFATRYSIAFNVAISDCLNSRLFLIDTWDKNIYENELIAFEMNVENPYYATGNVWVKKVAAHGPKTVNVTPDAVTTQQHSFALSTSYVLGKLNLTDKDLQSHWELSEDQLFMIGETLTSLDSRFWGPISSDDMVGRAYAIF